MPIPSFLSAILPGLAGTLDLALGDPPGAPHPVRLIGRAADLVEAWARSDERHLRLKGGLAVFALAALSGSLVYLLDAIPYLGWACAVYFAYAGLALGCLLREGRAVARLLNEDRLIDARRRLAGLVSRDTANMGPDALRRSLAETLSENLGDGLVAPLFFLVLLGPPGLWAYKAV
ncbi:MAG: CobD/CbiB family cobalamin biosynthesis protein, partial [Desulfovibrionaceae bacterium]